MIFIGKKEAFQIEKIQLSITVYEFQPDNRWTNR